MADETMSGRAEALEIILHLEAECGLDDYVESLECGNGDANPHWNYEKLKELFKVDKKYEESPKYKLHTIVDDMYWRLVAEKSSMSTFRELVRDLIAQVEEDCVNKGNHGALELLKSYAKEDDDESN